MCRRLFLSALLLVGVAASAVTAGDGNRLAYLDAFGNPYYVGRSMAKLTTPQWVGDPRTTAALVLSIDDMSNPDRYEAFLRPVLERLKRIDGRAPLSIMTTHVDTAHPQLQAWLREGVTIEAHTYDHPCPCLQANDLGKAKSTYDRSIDLLATIPNSTPVAFRMPCCDSMNSMSPRVFSEILTRKTPEGRFIQLDSSIFVLLTPNDSGVPRDLVCQEDGRNRFEKYVPRDRDFVNYVEDYPYPFVIDRLLWEMPAATPDDWQGHNLNGSQHETTIADMKAAIDVSILKEGVFTLTFHPHSWIRADQVVELIDHAVRDREETVRFFSFRDVLERLTTHVLGGQPLRKADGRDNGVRLLDVNNDGFMDVVIGNDEIRQTRIWDADHRAWRTQSFPVKVVAPAGNTVVRFGILNENGHASFVACSGSAISVWHFQNGRWVRDERDTGAAVSLSSVADLPDRGVRLRDLDGDGICELLVGNSEQSAVFQWNGDVGSWSPLAFRLPEGTAIVDERGRDAGFRLVDLDGDSRRDIVFSNGDRFSVHRFVSSEEGWSQAAIAGAHGGACDIPPIVRSDSSNNGVWFKQGFLWLQNEETGKQMPNQVDKRSYRYLLGASRS